MPGLDPIAVTLALVTVILIIGFSSCCVATPKALYWFLEGKRESIEPALLQDIEVSLSTDSEGAFSHYITKVHCRNAPFKFR
jgi:hypothetical protein